MNTQLLSGRTLAFLGDATWSLIVRKHLIEKGHTKGKDLQKRTIDYVSAKAQSKFYDELHAEGFFTEVEEENFKRGRNDNSGTVPKSTPMGLYRKSTGFEALLGALTVDGNWERIEEIWDRISKTGE